MNLINDKLEYNNAILLKIIFNW